MITVIKKCAPFVLHACSVHLRWLLGDPSPLFGLHMARTKPPQISLQRIGGERKTEENNIYGKIKRKGWCQTQNLQVLPLKHQFYPLIDFATASESLKARGEPKTSCKGRGIGDGLSPIRSKHTDSPCWDMNS